MTNATNNNIENLTAEFIYNEIANLIEGTLLNKNLLEGVRFNLMEQEIGKVTARIPNPEDNDPARAMLWAKYRAFQQIKRLAVDPTLEQWQFGNA